jgi:GAF domain
MPTNAVTEAMKAPRPALDEDMFQQLLAAAFVLQEHNDRLRAAQKAEAQAVHEVEAAEAAMHENPEAIAKSKTKNRLKKPSQPGLPVETKPAASAPEQLQLSATTVRETPTPEDTSQTLAEIVATQHQIQMSNLDFQEALDLIAERAKRIVRADGALIGLLEGDALRYQAGAGNALKLVGMQMPAESCLTTECLKYGATLQSADVSCEYRLEPESCAKLGIHGLIAVPVFYQGSVMGSLELHFAKVNAFREPDIRSCQLMAGLITEAKARAEEQEWKQALAVERESMREALAKLKPQLQKLVGAPERPQPVDDAVVANSATCEHCGSEVEAHQLLCGVCGAEREGAGGGANRAEVAYPSKRDLDDATPLLSDETLDRLEASLAEIGDRQGSSPGKPTADTAEESIVVPATADAAVPEIKGKSSVSPWGSAAKAREWLESLRQSEKGDAVRMFWKIRRADVYLGIAVVIAVIAVVWAIRSGSPAASENNGIKPSAAVAASAPAGKSPHKQAPPEPKLSLIDKLLISVGLADAPPAPVYEGNPDVRVWVDLHTALYYCPGADLYGKTVKGKFTTQRDAQLDQFEPAGRKACE